MRDQSAYRVAARRFKAVSPAAQQAVNSVDLPVHDPGAEDRAGHAQPFEAEEQGLVHGAAQEVGVGQGNFPSARGSRPVRIAHDARAGTSSADGVGSCPHIRPPEVGRYSTRCTNGLSIPDTSGGRGPHGGDSQWIFTGMRCDHAR